MDGRGWAREKPIRQGHPRYSEEIRRSTCTGISLIKASHVVSSLLVEIV